MAEEIKVDIYDRKPARIAAVRVTRENCHDVARWLKENDIPAKVQFHFERIEFFTNHKTQVKFGDWLIRGEDYRFAPCKDPHFRKNYQKAMIDA